MPDAQLLDLPGNEEPINQLWAFVSIDAEGKEGICGMSLNGNHFPMVTAKPNVVEIMRAHAREISKLAGKPVRLMRFTQREVVETITAGMN